MLLDNNSTIEEILEKYPESNKWLLERNIHCTQCGEPIWGTLADRIKSRGWDSDEIIEQLNEYLKSLGY